MTLIPKGGRGVKAPYESTNMRVPIPIKADVERFIRDYRNSILGGESDSLEDENKPVYEYCLKLVNEFIQDNGFDKSLTSPRSQNLYRFRDWLKQKCALDE
jgi:uncharacterized lipoprotein